MADSSYCTQADISGLGSEFTIPAAWTGSGEIDALILRWSQFIDAKTRKHFGKTSATFEVSGHGTPILDLLQVTNWLIVDISQVLERSSYDISWSDSSVSTIASTDYAISPSRHGLLRTAPTTLRAGMTTKNPIWLRGDFDYRVQGNFGAKAVPDPIKRAVALLCREEITPGSTRKYERFQSEKWPDGYSYSRSTSTDSINIPVYSGFTYIDSLIAPFVDHVPIMAAIL